MKINAVIATIVGAINNGSRMYNNGDIQGCAVLYETTSRHLLNSGIEGFPKSIIEGALIRSTVAANQNEKAWLLRNAFDDILSNSQVDDDENYMPLNAVVTTTLINLNNFSDEASQLWYPVHDNVMGGISSGVVSCSEMHEMVFSGTIRTDYNGGFASIRRNVDFNVEGFDGFFIDVRCDDETRIYSFSVKDDLCIQMGGVNFKHRFRVTKTNSDINNGLTRMYFPFEKLSADFRGRAVSRPPLNTKSIREVSIMAIKPPGAFQLIINNIGVYK